jgi:Flavodoxin domain
VRSRAFRHAGSDLQNRPRTFAVDAIVVYESIFGNTRAIAEAIAEGLGSVTVLPVHEAAERRDSVDLLVVGGPTHMHGLSTARSRRLGAGGDHEDGGSQVEPGATEEPGLRSWLRDLPPDAAQCGAAFDTRFDKSPWVTGVAARGIARRLRHHGIEVLATESFLVESSEGPLVDGEIDRAREWGATLARSIAATAEHPVGA